MNMETDGRGVYAMFAVCPHGEVRAARLTVEESRAAASTPRQIQSTALLVQLASRARRGVVGVIGDCDKCTDLTEMTTPVYKLPYDTLAAITPDLFVARRIILPLEFDGLLLVVPLVRQMKCTSCGGAFVCTFLLNRDLMRPCQLCGADWRGLEDAAALSKINYVPRPADQRAINPADVPRPNHMTVATITVTGPPTIWAGRERTPSVVTLSCGHMFSTSNAAEFFQEGGAFVFGCGDCHEALIERLKQSDIAILVAMSYAEYLKSEWWTEYKRPQRRKYDGEKCVMCGARDHLEVHHNSADAYKRRGQERLDDLITLCRDCHQTFHNHRHLSAAAPRLTIQ